MSWITIRKDLVLTNALDEIVRIGDFAELSSCVECDVYAHIPNFLLDGASELVDFVEGLNCLNDYLGELDNFSCYLWWENPNPAQESELSSLVLDVTLTGMGSVTTQMMDTFHRGAFKASIEQSLSEGKCVAVVVLDQDGIHLKEIQHLLSE